MCDSEVLAAFDALFEELLDKRDAEAATTLFVTDDDALMTGSEVAEHAVGTAAIAALHRAIAGSPAQLSFQWRRRALHREDGVAWINADGEIRVDRDGAAPATVPYRLTAVLVHREGSWRWHTFSGSQPRE